MAKEKFELVFMGGGALFGSLSTRLRRPPVTTRESIGAAMYEVEQALLQRPPAASEADNVTARLRVIREELCAETPSLSVMTAQLDTLALTASPAGDLAAALAHLRARIEAWLD